MKIKIYIDKLNKKEILDVKTIREAIKKLKISENEYIIAKNNELVTIDSKIKNNDEIKFLSVVSGG